MTLTCLRSLHPAVIFWQAARRARGDEILYAGQGRKVYKWTPRDFKPRTFSRGFYEDFCVGQFERAVAKHPEIKTKTWRIEHKASLTIGLAP